MLTKVRPESIEADTTFSRYTLHFFSLRTRINYRKARASTRAQAIAVAGYVSIAVSILYLIYDIQPRDPDIGKIWVSDLVVAFVSTILVILIQKDVVNYSSTYSEIVAQACFLLLIISHDVSASVRTIRSTKCSAAITDVMVINMAMFLLPATNPLSFLQALILLVCRSLAFILLCLICSNKGEVEFFGQPLQAAILIMLSVAACLYKSERACMKNYLGKGELSRFQTQIALLQAKRELEKENLKQIGDMKDSNQNIMNGLVEHTQSSNYSQKFLKTSGGFHHLDESGGFLDLSKSRYGMEGEKLRRHCSKMHQSMHSTKNPVLQSNRLTAQNLSIRIDTATKIALTDEKVTTLIWKLLMLAKGMVMPNEMFDWNFGQGGILNPPQFMKGHELFFVLHYSFSHYDLFQRFPIEQKVLHKFVITVEAHYLQVPYHNRLHAADVVHTAFWMLTSGEIDRKENITLNLIFATLIGSAIHDIGHPGQGNSFHVNCENSLSLAFNDMHCLENYHLFLAFSIIRQESCNVLKGVTQADKREVRQLLVDSVIATDLALHFEKLEKLNQSLASEELDLSDLSNASLICSSILHAADISSPAKEWSIYQVWIDRVFFEFISQGDEESRMGITPAPMMTRELSNPAKSQQGFINYFVLPLYTSLVAYAPKLAETPLMTLNRNLEHLQEWEAEYDNKIYISTLLNRGDLFPSKGKYTDEIIKASKLKVFDDEIIKASKLKVFDFTPIGSDSDRRKPGNVAKTKSTNVMFKR